MIFPRPKPRAEQQSVRGRAQYRDPPRYRQFVGVQRQPRFEIDGNDQIGTGRTPVAARFERDVFIPHGQFGSAGLAPSRYHIPAGTLT